MKIASDLKRQALEIFYHALKAVDPARLVRGALGLEDSVLKITDKSYNLKDFSGVYALGIGKAAAPMAQALEELLGEWLKGGIVVVKEGHSLPLRKLKILEAGHPIPDKSSQDAARTALDWAEGLGEKDLVFCLISGGGSALLCAPPEGISLEEVRKVTSLLLASGAEIKEMNTLRKRLSLIHGGMLARALHPAVVVNLIISDVVGNALDMVSSGPTLPDSSTFKGALEIVSKYELAKGLPERVYEYLKRGANGEAEETPKEGSPCFFNSQTFLIGSNMKALEAAKEKAVDLGYNTLILGSFFTGEAREVAKVFSAVTRECRVSGNPLSMPACLLAGGETTVTLRGKGKGGRNQ
ncbi:MAG TPA: glycerate kinase type-2 family protein [Candidatus Hypogeohydataceae bacterium YC40]